MLPLLLQTCRYTSTSFEVKLRPSPVHLSIIQLVAAMLKSGVCLAVAAPLIDTPSGFVSKIVDAWPPCANYYAGQRFQAQDIYSIIDRVCLAGNPIGGGHAGGACAITVLVDVSRFCKESRNRGMVSPPSGISSCNSSQSNKLSSICTTPSNYTLSLAYLSFSLACNDFYVCNSLLLLLLQLNITLTFFPSPLAS